ncbi:hypothetical protein [Mucilaginibacter sp. FT3.2]|uniref:hypothetical protein n=1 Tax=Mucilaginibacter sp. FT3.2 TaxID=2723090 RepID=UPI00161D41A7|nr:hypothetical protein [Mucilaginibacter sp. FT3.2]MBB6234289.1 hypothetical protein [Mucilaginibacter sp. FT3.2]
MHPYLSRLGVPIEVQSFFRPFHHPDPRGNLIFSYGDAVEHFGFAFHKIPNPDEFWMAGNLNRHMISDVFIAGSAMECIAFLSLHPTWLTKEDHILFLSMGTLPKNSQLEWICRNLGNKTYHLLFGRDLLGRGCDLKVAAALRGWPIEIAVMDEVVQVVFRHAIYTFQTNRFSLHAFEKAAGYRFAMRTHKSNKADTYLSQVLATAF